MMKSKSMIVGQALVAAMAPMLLAAWVAQLMGPDVLRSDAAMIAIPACGYAGIAIFLLAHGGSLSLELRGRLLLSISAISVIPASTMLAAAGSSQVTMPLLALATLASLPLALAGVCELVGSGAEGLRKDEVDDHELALGVGVLVWSLSVPTLVLGIMAEHFNMTAATQWIGVSLILNGCVFLWSCVLGLLGLIAGGITGLLEAVTGSVIEDPRYRSNLSGYKWADSDDDVCMVNPSTGLQMDGGVDIGGYAMGEDPSSHEEPM
jgi:hypothetical protein